MKKIVVIGVIALFIVVGFQPALAIEPKLSANNIEKVEDCDCQSVSEIDFNSLDKTTDRLESYIGLLSLLSKRNPKIAEKCKELSESISKLIALNGDNSIICFFLLIYAFYLMVIWSTLDIIRDKGNCGPILTMIIESWINTLLNRFDYVGYLTTEYYDCNWDWPPY